MRVALRVILIVLTLAYGAAIYGQAFRHSYNPPLQTVDQVRIDELERRFEELDSSHLVSRVVRLETIVEQTRVLSSGSLGGTILLLIAQALRITRKEKSE